MHHLPQMGIDGSWKYQVFAEIGHVKEYHSIEKDVVPTEGKCSKRYHHVQRLPETFYVANGKLDQYPIRNIPPLFVSFPDPSTLSRIRQFVASGWLKHLPEYSSSFVRCCPISPPRNRPQIFDSGDGIHQQEPPPWGLTASFAAQTNFTL